MAICTLAYVTRNLDSGLQNRGLLESFLGMQSKPKMNYRRRSRLVLKIAPDLEVTAYDDGRGHAK